MTCNQSPNPCDEIIKCTKSNCVDWNLKSHAPPPIPTSQQDILGFQSRPCINIYPPRKKFITNRELAIGAGVHPSVAHNLHPVVQQKLRAAFLTSNLWPLAIKDPKTGKWLPYHLNIHFQDGTDEQKTWVRTVIQRDLEPLVPGLKFCWVNAPKTSDFTPCVPTQDVDIQHIRVSFKQKGAAYSQIGKAALQVPDNQHTVNLGWIDDGTDYDVIAYKNTGQVVQHEFGHAMGMIHEHQNPINNPICWNKKCVSCVLSGSPNNWDQSTIDHNMFQKYSKSQINGSTYDPLSIMEYFFARSWVACGPNLRKNKIYSEMDKRWLGCAYPKEPTTGDMDRFTRCEGAPAIGPAGPGKPSKAPLTWLWITIGVVGGIILLIVVFSIIAGTLKKRRKK